jgi:RNA polymerase sigma factor (sigma-70 family)
MENLLADFDSTLPVGSRGWQNRVCHIVEQIVRERFAGKIQRRVQTMLSLEDIVQETSLKVVDVFSTADCQHELTSGFIQVVAQRILIDKVRYYLSRKRSPSTGLIDVHPQSSQNLLQDIRGPSPTASKIAIQGEVWPRIMAVITESERELLELHYGEELSSDEIAEILGVRPGTVRAQLSRLHRRLRSRLQADPFFESRL